MGPSGWLPDFLPSGVQSRISLFVSFDFSFVFCVGFPLIQGTYLGTFATR
jgi:hypothetical protein